MEKVTVNSYKYKFSIIIPIYNVEDYLEETILSVINQTIGFEKNIQMILVNDGSPDNSEEICLKYKEKYPNNIIYVKQENAGVSAARNNGMSYIEGKYVNFLDSDDKWDLDAFEKVYKFFEKNYGEIDVVACRIRLFESREGFHHALDYKFNKNKIVDIFEDYDNIQLSSASVFFKESIIKNYKYDTELKYTEDGKLLAYIILEKEKYGIFRSAVYNYRKRITANSAIDSGSNDVSWYINTIEKCYKDLFLYSIKKYGSVIPYIQYQIMYDLQWRLNRKINDTLSENTKLEYINNVKWLLEKIDDYIICCQKKMVIEYKIYAMCLKYDRDIRNELVYDKGRLYFNNINLYYIRTKNFVSINLLNIEEGNLKLEGKIKTILPDKDYKIYVLDNKKNKYELKYYDLNFDNKYAFDDNKVIEIRGFRIDIPIKNISNIKFVVCYKERYVNTLNVNFGKFAKITKSLKKSYFYNKDYIIRQHKNTINIYKYNSKLHFKFEGNYIRELLKDRRSKIVLYRLMYYITKLFIKKDIWIISDRTHAANDNGMHLFKYIQSVNTNSKIYFAIDKNSKDYNEMKKYGNILKMNSLKYKLYFLMSKNIISSHADEWVINAFGKKREFLKDLYKFNFVFLQHGIIKDDLSKWLNKQNKNVKIFITTTESEYNSIIEGGYGYDDSSVKLTGLPRYDSLIDKKEKKIVIMPTWRKNIAKETIEGTSLREYDNNFKNTEYFNFYNSLINDERLLKTLSRKGYKGIFCVHPSFEKQSIDFKSNKYIEVSNELPNYQKEFSQNSLLITDYSSVAFDFAYLKKPIVYTQFDSNTFFSGHSYDKGYFDYEEDGFGKVCYDYDSSIEEIIKIIENDCMLDEIYLDRINSFYKYKDSNNCERVYNEILNLK